MKFLDAKIGLWALEGGYWLVFRPFSCVFSIASPLFSLVAVFWRLRLIELQFNELYLGICFFDDFALEVMNLYGLIDFGEILVVVQYESRKCIVLVIFRQVDAEHVVDFIDFESCRNNICVGICLLCDKLFVVVFILDFSENFLYDIFECDDPCRSTEFIDNGCDRFFLLQECVHEFVERNRFRHNRNRYDTGKFVACFFCIKELCSVYVADNVIDILLVDDDFRISCFDEFLFELLRCSIVREGIDFRPRNHAVAPFLLVELKGIFDELCVL